MLTPARPDGVAYKLHSALNGLRQRRHRREIDRIYQRAIAAVDERAFSAAFRDHVSRRTPRPSPKGPAKYLNIRPWLRQAADRYVLAGLGRMSRGRRVLDLGSGAGYFPLICRTEGHRPLALDLDDEPLYRELIEFFGLPRLVHRIAPLQSLPDDLGEFDVVTAFRICFDTNGDGSQWGADEWAFLLQDLRTRLTPGGRVVLGFNVNRQTGTFYSPATAALLKQLPGYRTRLFFEYALLTRTA